MSASAATPPAPREVRLSMEDAEEIAFGFGIGNVRDVALAARGWVSLNVLWRLTTDDGVWAVKEITREDTAALEAASEIERAAGASGIAVAPVVATRAGPVTLELGLRRFRCHGFVDGVVPVADLRASDTEQAGHALGRLHALELPWAPHLMVPTVFGGERWDDLVEQGARLDAPWVGALRAALPAILAAEVEAAEWAAVPRRWVGSHRDVRPENTLRSGGSLVLIDWDGAGPVVPEVEVAGALRWWEPHEAVFLRAYAEVAGEVDLEVGRGENGGLVWWLHENVRHALAMPDDAERAWAVQALAGAFVLSDGRGASHAPDAPGTGRPARPTDPPARGAT